MGRIWEESLQIQQQHSTFPAIAPEVPMKLFLQSPEMPVKPLVPLACPIVIDHTGVIQRNQNFITKNLVDLPISDMWGIYGANLPTLPQSKMGTLHRLPSLIQNILPALGCPGKQVGFKVLNTLLPSYPVTAFAPIEEHRAIAENLVDWPKCITPGLFSFLPLDFAALVSCFMPFLACHNKKVFAFRTDIL